MRAPIQELKRALRRHVRKQLAGISVARRTADSARACALLERQGVWREARSILFYAPLPVELDVWPLVTETLAAGRTVALPRFDATAGRYVACRIANPDADLRTGVAGIREPADHCAPFELNRVDLILVSGLGFDTRGGRLGRGKGHYDQLLSRVRGITCGVAFDEQIVAAVPLEAHDVRVEFVLTPTRWIETQARSTKRS
jgi:5-formyltetrahydrofolate cyclo-ligase